MNDLGLVILGLATRTTVLAGFGLLGALALKRRGPSARALASSTTLAVLVALTVLAASPWPRWWSPGEVEPARSAQVATGPITKAGPVAETLGPKPAPAVATASPTGMAFADFFREFQRELTRPTQDLQGSRWRWSAWLALGWLIVLAVALVRLALGLWAVRSLRNRSLPLTDPGLLRLVETLREAMRLKAAVEVLETTEVATAATIGWLKPVILLPKDWSEWTEVERRAVLSHELGHIFRGDYLSGLAAQVSLTLHAYHPLVHALAGRLRLEQELAADAWGAQLSGGRRAYLTALANLALRQAPKQEPWPSRAFLPSRGTFLRRIEMLRDPQAWPDSSALPRRTRLATVTAVVLAGLLLAGFRGPERPDRALAQEPATPRRSTVVATLDLDPSTASSDVHFALDFRPAALLKNPEIKKLADRLPESSPKLFTLLTSGDIHQVVVLGFDREPVSNGGSLSQFCMLLVATKAIDWQPLLLIEPRPVEVQADGFTYYRLGNAPNAACFRILEANRALYGSEADVKNPPIGSNRPRGRHGWDDAWKKLAPGPIRLAVDTPWLARQVLPAGAQPGQKGQISPVATLAGPLLDRSQAYGATLGLADGLTLDVLATSANEEGARRVADTVRAYLTLGRNALPDLRRMAEGGPPEAARTLVGLSRCSRRGPRNRHRSSRISRLPGSTPREIALR